MKSAVVVATSVLAISGAAWAGPLGGYVGLALGTRPSFDMHQTEPPVQSTRVFANPAGRSLRGFVGARFASVRLASFAAEVALNSFDLVTDNYGRRSVTGLSLAGKVNVPIDNGFEVFGRLGIERSWLGLDNDRIDMAGNGLLLGAGIEYRIRFTAVEVSLFVDYNYRSASLDNMVGTNAMTAHIFALGTSVGF